MRKPLDSHGKNFVTTVDVVGEVHSAQTVTLRALFKNLERILMGTQIHRKQIVMLVLSIMLAVGSYWIPLPSSISMQNLELPKNSK